MIKTVSKFERILNNSVQNKITCTSSFWSRLFGEEPKTYIYKDMREYEIKDLFLRNPTFENTERNNIVLVKDKWTNNDCEIERELLVDLVNKTYIETKYKKQENE